MCQILKNIVLIDDDEIDSFVIKKLILAIYQPISLLSFKETAQALSFFKALDSLHDNYIVLLDLYIEPDWAWDFLDKLKQLPHNVYALCEVYIISSSPFQEKIDVLKQYKNVKGYFEKPFTKEHLERVLLSAPQNENNPKPFFQSQYFILG